MVKLTKEERLKTRRLNRLGECIYSMLAEGECQYRLWLNTRVDQMRHPAALAPMDEVK